MRFPVSLLSAIIFCLPLAAQNNPKANPEAVVEYQHARFTVLTDRLIRMEWAQDDAFEDRASFAIVNRDMPVPKFSSAIKNGILTIKTEKVTLTYKGGRFSQDNLSVKFGMGVWKPGMAPSGNLKGTTRTLDGCLGFEQLSHSETELEDGILSRDGWAVVDESSRHLFEPVGSPWENWVAERPDGDRIDWYLFAYGHDYTAALGDFVKVAGRIPLPPKYTFGYWWSRYWVFTDEELLDLGREMRQRGVPMDVMIVDMDWHYTYGEMQKRLGNDVFGQGRGWTGYSWNRELFPDPEGFLHDLHSLGFKTALNLHPASGIREYEDCYDVFVKDYLSRTNDYDGPKDYVFGAEPYLYAGNPEPVGAEGHRASVPYRMSQQQWADAYFNSVIRPLERQGVDFWWLDWQQWMEDKYVKGLSNTFWVNYAFFQDKENYGAERPFIYHRWGGLGSHRYQLGFSGDTYDEWSVLKFLPYFTSTASNVGYGYWGHDIGGHMQKKDHQRLTDPQMYTRWLQFDVFTPIFKTHSTQSANLERKIWAYPDYYEYMLAAIRLRYTLSPYIYTFARETFDTGVSLCRPLYYYWPEKPQAYDYKQEYLFGDRILATAICEASGADGKSACKVWFPNGFDWYDMAVHTTHKGGSIKTLRYSIGQNPWYVKAGSILPLASPTIENLQTPDDALGILVVPGSGKSTFTLYEDDGVSKDYATSYAKTLISKTRSGNRINIVISAREGSYPGMSASRKPFIVLEGITSTPKRILCNGTSCGEVTIKDSSTVITLPEISTSAETTIEILLTQP
ncbi:MAG: DUF5110 domain-containing protein [Bacteroidales bacterium]|nr:DUF5110 domain-containing protein [Bacteroidales bacterium]